MIREKIEVECTWEKEWSSTKNDMNRSMKIVITSREAKVHVDIWTREYCLVGVSIVITNVVSQERRNFHKTLDGDVVAIRNDDFC